MPLISIDHTIVYDWDDKTQVSPRSSRSPRSHQFWWGYSMLCPSFSRFLIVTWGPMGQNFISIHKQCQESIGLLGKIRVPLTYWKGIITIYYWNSQIAINTPVEPIRNQLTLKFFPDPSKDGPMVLETPKTAKTHKYNFWQYYISSMVVIQNHNSDTKTMVMFDSIVSLYHPFFSMFGSPNFAPSHGEMPYLGGHGPGRTMEARKLALWNHARRPVHLRLGGDWVSPQTPGHFAKNQL